jgi:signal transduction histidine kinase
MGLLGRLRRLAARPHLPRRTVRLRLTALYGALFLASGIALLTVTYLLVSRATGDYCQSVQEPSGGTVTHCVRGSAAAGPADVIDAPTQQFQTAPEKEAPPELTQEQKKVQARLIQEAAVAQRDAQMHQLLVNSGVAIGAMAIVSIGLGWVVAGRALRPLRTITSTARRISARSLHERLSMTGPDDELKELADTFDDLLARLERSFEAQRRFVANASHELRTPLARQRTVAQVALADPEANVGSLRAAHERVMAAGEEQERLIDALLILARGQAGLRMREPFDLSSVTNNVLLARQAEAMLGGVDVRQTLSPASAAGDRRLVERLIANVVDNALSYNRPEGHIDVLVGTRDGHAVVSVTNTGPVVPPAEVERLLQPFQRNGPDRIGHGHGLGLGLSIVQAIAEAHDAALDVRPRAEGGLVVEVSFPEVASTNGGESTSAPERPNQNVDPTRAELAAVSDAAAAHEHLHQPRR